MTDYDFFIGEEALKTLEEICGRATPGPWATAQFDESRDPIEWIRDCLAHGSGPVHAVWCPKHPLTRGEHPNPEHAVVAAITGNGPTSEAQAEFISIARETMPLLIAEVRRLRGLVERRNRNGHPYGCRCNAPACTGDGD